MNSDDQHMLRALELAALGAGHVEPNPQVGCVIVRDGVRLGEGWHRRFGGPHAEIEALRSCPRDPRGATMYVTLEPCCHTGKTPPCSEAIIRSGVARVVVAMPDPFPAVAGGGLAQLRAAGIPVDVGVQEPLARMLNAPYLMLLGQGRPWVIAKWAMTLDGKIAARTGHSRWISNESSRAVVHQLRGRMDAIMVGRRTAAVDDPLLTARPAGARQATRIVFDGPASLRADSQLAQTARETPVLIAVAEDADPRQCDLLSAAGCEVLRCAGHDASARLKALLQALGRRRWTNLLVEGGAGLLGGFFDLDLVDEIHVFVAPKVVGGQQAPGPVAGLGLDAIPQAARWYQPHIEILADDVYIKGRLRDSRASFEA